MKIIGHGWYARLIWWITGSALFLHHRRFALNHERIFSSMQSLKREDTFLRHIQADAHIGRFYRTLCRTKQGDASQLIKNKVQVQECPELFAPATVRPIIFSLHWVDLFFCVAGLANYCSKNGTELMVIRRQTAMNFNADAIVALTQRSGVTVHFVAPGEPALLQKIQTHLDKNWPVLILVDLWGNYGPTRTIRYQNKSLQICTSPFLLAKRLRASIFIAKTQGSAAHGGLTIKVDAISDAPVLKLAPLMQRVTQDLWDSIGDGYWLSWDSYPNFFYHYP
ncbi:hypothetical protein [Glaciimonas sp. PAMC28666]|uniref:hypothetical protein n=1 Tax=Glaciimonas sp. PAMC28666 TaxID=2807626 RepID=UPI001966894A|nr:hypothetical protein [Glaciimonas sp. PAMC28666]QRX84128.1 hypothetical protein JQN73_08030 [Glaciimonas sp. PAMC28666]